MELKKIGVLSLAKISGLFGVVYGLIAGILVVILLSTGVEGMAEQLGLFGDLGYGIVVVLPLFYGVLYFISGSIAALIYNMFAGWVGGINLDFKK